MTDTEQMDDAAILGLARVLRAEKAVASLLYLIVVLLLAITFVVGRRRIFPGLVLDGMDAFPEPGEKS